MKFRNSRPSDISTIGIVSTVGRGVAVVAPGFGAGIAIAGGTVHLASGIVQAQIVDEYMTFSGAWAQATQYYPGNTVAFPLFDEHFEETARWNTVSCSNTDDFTYTGTWTVGSPAGMTMSIAGP